MGNFGFCYSSRVYTVAAECKQLLHIMSIKSIQEALDHHSGSSCFAGKPVFVPAALSTCLIAKVQHTLAHVTLSAVQHLIRLLHVILLTGELMTMLIRHVIKYNSPESSVY